MSLSKQAHTFKAVVLLTMELHMRTLHRLDHRVHCKSHKRVSYIIDSHIMHSHKSRFCLISQDLDNKPEKKSKMRISKYYPDGLCLITSLNNKLCSSSPEDEQRIQFETSMPRQLFSEPTLSYNKLLHVCTL